MTVKESGLLLKGTNERGAFINPLIPDGGALPRRLEPRSSVTVYGTIDKELVSKNIRCAYARTECGFLKKGQSPALKQIAKGGRL